MSTNKIPSYTHLYDALAGGQRQSHQTGSVDWHDLVSYVQPSRPLGRPGMHHVGNDYSGQDGAPATLHNDHAQNLTFTFFYEHLGSRQRQANPLERQTEIKSNCNLKLIIMLLDFAHEWVCVHGGCSELFG